jgi:hypothetical protein
MVEREREKENLKYRNNLKEFEDCDGDIAVLVLQADCITYIFFPLIYTKNNFNLEIYRIYTME